MKLIALTAALLATAIPFVSAVAVEKRQTTTTRPPDSQCTHGPRNRGCWSNGYSIATDFDLKFPVTGNTVTHNLEITNTTCNPDGAGERMCMLLNGQYPGPTITATWGDTLIINVKNSMQHNGTSIHWHGIRQYHSVGEDGVNGITECALAPGDEKTYRFQVTQFGTSWYHAHYSSQYGDGIVGPMVIDGPATSNYEEDLGPYTLTDWYYQTAWQVQAIASQRTQAGRGAPPADNILINGTNKNPAGGGEYNQVSITRGKKYRLRLINASVDVSLRVSLDGHLMQVISNDFIPIKPYTTETILLAIGQRYDVIITANQPPGNYWFRASNAGACLSGANSNALAIWTYDGVDPDTPASTSYAFPTDCTEPTNLAPYWVQRVPQSTFRETLGNLVVNQTRAVIVPGHDAIVVWALNETSINVAWDQPTLAYLLDNPTAPAYPDSYHVIPTLSSGQWNYWLIQQGGPAPGVPHPIHLHGHDFFVLGQGVGTFSVEDSFDLLNFDTPPRRDTASVPGRGWLVIAFPSNNPGIWLMHCHIAWHVSQGLAMQFVESPGEITMPALEPWRRTCANYRAYDRSPQNVYIKDDSGL